MGLFDRWRRKPPPPVSDSPASDPPPPNDPNAYRIPDGYPMALIAASPTPAVGRTDAGDA